MAKPIVHFTSAVIPAVGGRAIVVTTDHWATDRVTPGHEAVTSKVVDVFSDGSFETENTHYVPTGHQPAA